MVKRGLTEGLVLFLSIFILVFFRLLIEPDQPEDLRAYANSSSELIIEWKPPINPNGIVSFYKVFGSWRRDDQDYVDKHDHCAERKTLMLPITK